MQRCIILGIGYFILVTFGWITQGQNCSNFNLKTNLPLSSKFLIDEEGNMILLSEDKTTLFKLLASQNYDSLLRFNRNGAFFSDFAITNRQQIFLLDDINQELVILSKDLRLITSYPYQTWELENPKNIAATLQGDIFFYEPESQTITRVDNLFKLLTKFPLPYQIQTTSLQAFHVFKDYLFLVSDSVLYVLTGRGWYQNQYLLSCSPKWISFNGNQSLYICDQKDTLQLYLLSLVPFAQKSINPPPSTLLCLKNSKFAIPFQGKIYILKEKQISIIQ